MKGFPEFPATVSYVVVDRGKVTRCKYVQLKTVIELFRPRGGQLDKLLGVENNDEEKKEEAKQRKYR